MDVVLPRLVVRDDELRQQLARAELAAGERVVDVVLPRDVDADERDHALEGVGRLVRLGPQHRRRRVGARVVQQEGEVLDPASLSASDADALSGKSCRIACGSSWPPWRWSSSLCSCPCTTSPALRPCRSSPSRAPRACAATAPRRHAPRRTRCANVALKSNVSLRRTRSCALSSFSPPGEGASAATTRGAAAARRRTRCAARGTAPAPRGFARRQRGSAAPRRPRRHDPSRARARADALKDDNAPRLQTTTRHATLLQACTARARARRPTPSAPSSFASTLARHVTSTTRSPLSQARLALVGAVVARLWPRRPAHSLLWGSTRRGRLTSEASIRRGTRRGGQDAILYRLRSSARW